MTENEQTVATPDIDQTVARIEQLYRAVTGRDAPSESGYAPIPAEKDPVEYVEKRLNRLLELLGAAPGLASAAPGWIPPMAVLESDTEILIRLDLPGVPRDQVRVTARDQVLTVSGNRPENSEAPFRLRSRESAAGLFRRTILVPGGLRASEPSAEMKSGVLEIRIAKESAEASAGKSVRIH